MEKLGKKLWKNWKKIVGKMTENIAEKKYSEKIVQKFGKFPERIVKKFLK